VRYLRNGVAFTPAKITRRIFVIDKVAHNVYTFYTRTAGAILCTTFITTPRTRRKTRVLFYRRISSVVDWTTVLLSTRFPFGRSVYRRSRPTLRPFNFYAIKIPNRVENRSGRGSSSFSRYSPLKYNDKRKSAPLCNPYGTRRRKSRFPGWGSHVFVAPVVYG